MIFGIKTKKDKKIEMLEAISKDWEARYWQILSEVAEKNCRIDELKKRNIELESRQHLVVHDFIKSTTLTATTAEEMVFDDANKDIIIRLLKDEVRRKISNDELLDQYIDYYVDRSTEFNFYGEQIKIKVTGYLNVVTPCK